MANEAARMPAVITADVVSTYRLTFVISLLLGRLYDLPDA